MLESKCPWSYNVLRRYWYVPLVDKTHVVLFLLLTEIELTSSKSYFYIIKFMALHVTLFSYIFMQKVFLGKETTDG